MSTKNLARTVIEGGRTRYSCWSRRHSHRGHRAAERAVLRKLQTTEDADAATFRGLGGAGIMFNDKLGPAKRWLQRQAGRPWALVRGELMERFDTRTTPGRHIVFDHMLPWVEHSHPGFFRRDFEIDSHGLLRKVPQQRRYRYRRTPEPLGQPPQEVERWLSGRRVGERGAALFWFTATTAGAYRQDRRLDEADVDRWRSFPDWFREEHSAPGFTSSSSDER